MPRAFSLQSLLELAQRQSDGAATTLGGLNAHVRGSEAKLNLLLRYREEYRARFRAALHQNTSSSGWRNFHDFMDKLDQAIEQQRAALLNSREMMQIGQREWRSAQRRVKTFDTLAQHHATTEARRLAKSEQREHDDRSGIAHRKNPR